MRALSKSELVSHPLRLRIVGAMDPQSLTSKQISIAMPDIPQATLYRQIKVLLDGGILEVVGRRQAHGVVELTYAMRQGSTHLTREEFASMSPEEHKTCLALLNGEAQSALARYVDQSAYDSTEDGMTYLAAQLMLTDEEAKALRIEILELLKGFSRKSNLDRRLRRVTFSLVPEPTV